MQKVALTASILSLTLALSACGGGGSDSSPANNAVAQATLFDGNATVYGFDLEGVDQDAERWTLTRQDGLLYVKANNRENYYNSYILAEDGLYEPETEATVDVSKGIRDSSIKSLTETKWIVTPYNRAGRKNLEITHEFKAVDLNGKVISPILSPATAAFSANIQLDKSDYVLASLAQRIYLNADVFPKNAKCLQIVSIESNKNHLEFDPTAASTQVQGVISLQEWASLEFKNKRATTPTVNASNWGGYNWGAVMLNGYDAKGQFRYDFAIDYNGKVFRADPIGGKTTLVDDLDKQAKELAGEGYSPELINSLTNNFKNACTFYNETAAKAIEQAIVKAKK